MITTTRPEVGEYAPSFADYVARVADDEDIVAVLVAQLDQVLAHLGRIPEARGNYRYVPDKWSVKEIVGHLCDTERVFAYRALRIGRGDSTPLASFEDQAYVEASRAGDRRLADLAAEWGDVRRATVALFHGLPAEAWHRRGIASDQQISVRALAYIIAGHVRHHLQTLDKRYNQTMSP
jgi:hypothetical protein